MKWRLEKNIGSPVFFFLFFLSCPLVGQRDPFVPSNSSVLNSTVQDGLCVLGIVYDAQNAQALVVYDEKRMVVRAGDVIGRYVIMGVKKNSVCVRNGEMEYEVFVR